MSGAAKQKEVCTCAQKPCIHYPALVSSQPVNLVSGIGYASPSHSLTSITGAIACLRSLTETLPGVLAVANGWAPSGHDFRNRDELLMAVDMLLAYRRYREEKEDEREKQRSDERDRLLGQTACEEREHGITIGIEREKARAKEARKGRKKNAPAKGAK